MSTAGTLSLVLHAHLPYVRHPEHPTFLEEDWLYEAITETYLPLLRMMDRLAADGVPFELTMSLSPPLAEMLADPLLRGRYSARLDGLVEVAQRAASRLDGGRFDEAIHWYVRELEAIRHLWNERPILDRLAEHERAGRLCLVTVAGTHGYLPLMATDEARRGQIATSVRTHQRLLGRAPDGIWLPECAYATGLEALCQEAGLRFFFAETHALAWARPRPRFGHVRPAVTEEGVVVFARDPECSKQVWSSEEGYPGDSRYREFYRDLGWDGDDDVVAPLLEAGAPRRGLGLKLHRVTGRVSLDEKEPWSPSAALGAARDHAAHFLAARQAQCARLKGELGVEPHLTAPFDAELFGHWWFEGPAFLEALFRHAAAQDPSGDVVRFRHPRSVLSEQPPLQVIRPAGSSWGDKGFYEVWLNETNAWIYKHLHRAEERMAELSGRFAGPSATELEARLLSQCARELLLAQASDWAFILTNRTVVPYAIKRTRTHLARFLRLAQMLEGAPLDEAALAEMESHDNAFSDVDASDWSPDAVQHPGAGAAVWSAS